MANMQETARINGYNKPMRVNARTREKLWSEEDLRYIYKNAGKFPVDVMAAHLRRTKVAVQHKCNQMGLSTKIK